MISEYDKQHLFEDLCRRLPYGVKFKTTSTNTTTLKSIGIGSLGLISINLFYKKPEFYLINEFGNLEFKPYLRPMSSMTDEEYNIRAIYERDIMNQGQGIARYYMSDYIKWLDRNHFDWFTDGNNKTLIDKDLAIAVTEDDNPYKEDVR